MKQTYFNNKQDSIFHGAYKVLTESMNAENWGNTYWADTINGKEIKVSINDLMNVTKGVPVIEMSTKILEPYALHKNKKDAETLANIQKSDLQYPIIVLKKNNKYQILDGHHRLQKAINNNIEKIKTKLIDINTLPDDWQELFR
jgi:disulfide oxidoreductase YuzD